MGYIAFDLGLSLGEVTKISTQPERGTPEVENAFTWRIRCDGKDVEVYGHDGAKVVRLGTARWASGELTVCEGKTVEFPNDYQWDLVAYGLGQALGETVRGRGRDMRARYQRPAYVAPKPDELAPRQLAARQRQAEASAKRKFAVAGLATAAVGTIAVIVFANARERPAASTAKVPAASPTPPVADPPVPIERRVASVRSLPEAVALIGSRLGDGANNQGAWLLARFASQRMAWEDVAQAETTIGLVLKDSERERGKRLCASGSIHDIERKDLDRRPVYVGALETAEGDGVRFIAVGSTGTGQAQHGYDLRRRDR